MWSRIISLAVEAIVGLILSTASEIQLGISGDASVVYLLNTSWRRCLSEMYPHRTL